jgi:hypothetical protein
MMHHSGAFAPRECEAVSLSVVIASEAKQSIMLPWNSVDCFVAPLLAMTRVR